MSNKTLKLVISDYWFEEIKSGRKKHEYRKATSFWYKRIGYIYCNFSFIETGGWDELKENKYFVEFQKAYRKNPDLRYDGIVFDIEHRERVK